MKAVAFTEFGNVRHMMFAMPGVELENVVKDKSAAFGMIERAGEVRCGKGTQQSCPARMQSLDEAEGRFNERGGAVFKLNPAILIVRFDRRFLFGECELAADEGVHVAVRNVMDNLADLPSVRSVRKPELMFCQSGDNRAQLRRKIGDFLDEECPVIPCQNGLFDLLADWILKVCHDTLDTWRFEFAIMYQERPEQAKGIDNPCTMEYIGAISAGPQSCQKVALPMLNYIWLALIILGVAVAVGHDWQDLSTNSYHNGATIRARLAETGGEDGGGTSCTVTFLHDTFNAAYGTTLTEPLVLSGDFVPLADGTGGRVTLTVKPGMPDILGRLAEGQRTPGSLAGKFSFDSGDRNGGTFSHYPVTFVKLQSVTSDGIIRYAKIAVELAIGLIGIMALWLGLMKIAEQSGLVAIIARVLRPLMTRIFPDVPPDHPAMGAMVMNISANMLGLMNAATPLGLKAMEELNKLNKKAGVATDAMCTFLVINTSNVQLIPATVIAIRASAGSSNPTEIIGPVILASIVTWIVGITTVKLMARLRIFRNQLTTEA